MHNRFDLNGTSIADCSESSELTVPLPKRFWQFARISLLLSPWRKESVCLRISSRRDGGRPQNIRRIRMKLQLKFGRPDDERAVRSGKIRHFTVRGDDRAIAPILGRQPLNDLIGPLAFLGIHHLDARAMLMALNAEALSPPIEDNRHRMALPLAVRRQFTHKAFARHLRPWSDLSPYPQEIVPVDDQMHAHKPQPSPRQSPSQFERRPRRRAIPGLGFS